MSNSGMPQMLAAFSGWTSKITLTKVAQSVVDGLVTEKLTNITFNGTIQPLSPAKIMLKPEGQRSWTWLQIHCLESKNDLNNNDIIVYCGKRYKIMAQNDYSLNNFVEYHALEDYQNG